MTDREELEALLTKWGVGFNGDRATKTGWVEEHPTDVYLHEGDPKIDGYHDFYARFEFDTDGAFQQVSVWE